MLGAGVDGSSATAATVSSANKATSAVNNEICFIVLFIGYLLR